jgi:diguanylate cyclase (GGDEF)-like protein
VGKTSLLESLRPTVTGSGGWFVSGKFDQYRRDQEFDGVYQAFRALGRLLLAEPDDELADVRQRLSRALGSSAGLSTAVLPELAALLRIPGDLGDPLTAQVRAQRNATEILRAVASRRRPIVFVVDDLQWAGRTPLGFIDEILSGGEEIDGLLLVGSYREGDVEVGHPLMAMIERWHRPGDPGTVPPGPTTLRLTNLSPSDLAAMLADLLRIDADTSADLAAALLPRTQGNPYDTVELLNTLRHEGLLTADANGWHCDTHALTERDRPDMSGLLAHRAAVMPRPTLALLRSMACLGGQVDLSILEAATGLSSTEVWDLLAPALDDGLVLSEFGSRSVFQFRHDRIRDAVLGDLGPRRGRALRLRLARRLGQRSEFFAVAAELYLPVIDAVREPAERALVVELLSRAADQAKLLSNYPQVERLLGVAVSLARFEDGAAGAHVATPAESATPVETATLVRLLTGRHLALYSVGRLEEADDVYTMIDRLATSPWERVDATLAQVSSLTNQGRAPEAIVLGVASLRDLGCTVPPPHLIEAESRPRLEELTRWMDQTTTADDLARPEWADPALAQVGALINRLMPPAFFRDQSMLDWLTLEAFRRWATYGPHPSLVGPFSHIAYVTQLRSAHRVGYQILRRILAVAEARGYEPQVSQAWFLYTLGSDHWFESIEDDAGNALRARRGLVAGGDLQNACWSHVPVIYEFIDCAPDLETYVAEVDAALQFARRTGNHHAAEVFVPYRHLAGALRGEPVDQASAPPGAMLSNPLAVVITHVTRALAATILDNPDELNRHVDAAMPMLEFIGPAYPTATAHVLQALSLVHRARAARRDSEASALADLDEATGWLAERAADAPENFLHLVQLIEAERAWTIEDFRAAVTAFEAAQRSAAQTHRPWHRALILERAARFYLAHGVETIGHHLLAQARHAYQAFGASAKVDQLDWAFPTVRAAADLPPPGRPESVRPESVRPESVRPEPGLSEPGPTEPGPSESGRPEPGLTEPGRPESGRAAPDPLAPAARHRGTSTIMTGTIDLLGIHAASQALSSEKTIGGLRGRVVEILSAMTGATSVDLLLFDDEHHRWLVPAPDGDAAMHPLDSANRGNLAPQSVVRYVERTRETVVVGDATRDERFARDPYLAGVSRCSLLALPIINRGDLRALLLLENRLIRGAFAADRLDAVTLIAGQLAVCLDNALVYASLEQRVAERTEQLMVANRRLEKLSITDPLTGVANRRRMDEVLAVRWRAAARTARPLAVAMVDLDRFKEFNDRHGHAAGDECLRRVARDVRRTVREGDLVARYGGEEFLVIMPDADLDTALEVAHRLRDRLATPTALHPVTGSWMVTASVGVAATVPTTDTGWEKLVTQADAELYKAKRAGRNRVRPTGTEQPGHRHADAS